VNECSGKFDDTISYGSTFFDWQSLVDIVKEAVNEARLSDGIQALFLEFSHLRHVFSLS
jgi:hypothetical protein